LNVLFKQKGIKAWCIPEGGTAMVYGPVDLAPEIARIEGVSKVLSAADFDPLGYPQPAANERMPNLVAAAAEGYSFGGAQEGAIVAPVAEGSTPGAHGYLNSDPEMNAIFVASGAGIKPGSKLPVIRNVDVAPTIARLLGLRMSGFDGRVLEEILL
jgi:hypothetical protein